MFIIGFLLVSNLVSAQPATPTSKIVFEQPSATATEALAMIHRFYLDGAATGNTSLVGKSCVASVAPVTPLPNVTCSFTIPSMGVGTHTIAITSAFSTSSTVESVASNTLSFVMQVVPATPSNVRIGKLLNLNMVTLTSNRKLLKFGRRDKLVGFMR